MKNILLVFLFICLTISGYSQVIPERNFDSLIVQQNVKSIRTFYLDPDTQKNHLIQKLEYDREGRMVEEYLLYLWDAVTYSYTNSYSYNSDQIKEIIKIQEILSLYPRDQDYIESFGDEPVNEKIVFIYNEDGQLEKKEIFVYHTQKLEENTPANQTIKYEYEDERLILEKSSSPEVRIFNYNYSISYDYDSAGNLIRKIREFGIDKPMKRETRYRYDSVGQVIEKIVIDPEAPHNNTYEKYEYDSLGNLSKLFSYSSEEEEFLLEFEYRYDDHGRRISGEREVDYKYLDNELIQSESWRDQKTNRQIVFTTEYEYF
jgi:uncharacterized protein RhaS with RHS repeats